jgi:hypothetical protein
MACKPTTAHNLALQAEGPAWADTHKNDLPGSEHLSRHDKCFASGDQVSRSA